MTQGIDVVYRPFFQVRLAAMEDALDARSGTVAALKTNGGYGGYIYNGQRLNGEIHNKNRLETSFEGAVKVIQQCLGSEDTCLQVGLTSESVAVVSLRCLFFSISLAFKKRIICSCSAHKAQEGDIADLEEFDLPPKRNRIGKKIPRNSLSYGDNPGKMIATLETAHLGIFAVLTGLGIGAIFMFKSLSISNAFSKSVLSSEGNKQLWQEFCKECGSLEIWKTSNTNQSNIDSFRDAFNSGKFNVNFLNLSVNRYCP
ncbi:hypothetical protein CONCODRAFT_3934 [Conidiobolus coronatus NRRL 28638]|uniref:Uncharacterized protein n=1 Tax=Conidiobolus coronatus (strain ATCC 28846 / CBS 209.66 / NRRL 28638) TaxID=796925 RepID=A0A137PE19_CONC2|nr:hypothetical protein CONCODRAFT_3934 [Conidiobolus coronatus NRRL 28638]|eukprot:KXN73254.1 hypothetical protein CONCODRAFT_3934 [Conidiobolus coronatus NRRL 28638]